MPACSSEYTSATTGYCSSSPPNSRSASASPPLSSWSTVVSSLSVSPSKNSPICSFERSISNLSNSSISHGNTNKSDEKPNTFSTLSHITHGISEPAPSVDRNPSRSDDENKAASCCHVDPVTHRLVRTRQQRQPGALSADKCNGGIRSKWFFPACIVAWYVNLVLNLLGRLYETLSYIVLAPIIWISAWICVFWVIMQLPLNLITWFIRALHTPASERARNKRCVLISGGSTLQALHLARNFYKAGARVIVCEIDGLFGLARFSTACSRFYSVPRPGPGTAAEYVNALRTIVEREKVVYFIPVSCTSGAYYDALAKPHLEIIGCECFVPAAVDVTRLEDPLRLIRRCDSLGLATPVHHLVKSPDELVRLYEIGSFVANERHVMVTAGPTGMTERVKLQLPTSGSIDNPVPSNLRPKLEHYEISDRKPWIVMHEPAGISGGYQLITCTTVKDSRVVANVTCRLDETRGLIPEERNDVHQWLETFFSRPFSTRINGHLSFKLAVNADEIHGLVPLSCRVGVPLPYLCLTSVHPRFVWRPCRHFSRQNSVNLLVNERYKKSLSSTNLRSASLGALFPPTRTGHAQNGRSSSRNDSSASDGHFVVPSNAVLDKRDALFVYWDPLPYCAYYHLQFPFRRLAGALREQPTPHKPPLAVVQ